MSNETNVDPIKATPSREQREAMGWFTGTVIVAVALFLFVSFRAELGWIVSCVLILLPCAYISIRAHYAYIELLIKSNSHSN